MKKIFFVLAMLISIAYGQTTAYLRYDSVKLAKNGGTTELIIENATKATTGGVLVNTGNGRTAFSAAGGSWTPTWQQTLTAGSTLTGANIVEVGGFDFTMQNANEIQLQSNTGSGFASAFISPAAIVLTSANTSSGTTRSSIGVEKDSIQIYPYLGNIHIDTLNNASTQNQLMGWTSSGGDRGGVGYITIGSGLSLSSGALSATATGIAIGNTVTSATAGSVFFAGTGGILQQKNDKFFYDSTNVRLGLGTNSPSTTIHATAAGSVAKFVSTGYSASTVEITDPDGSMQLTNSQIKAVSQPFVLNANASYIALQVGGVEKANLTTGGVFKVKQLQGYSSTPAIAGGAGAGTTPTVSITGTDLAGEITVTTDTDPITASVFCTITFATAFGTAPYVVITPANIATADDIVTNSTVYVNSTTTTFTINTNNIQAPAASTQFKYHYHVIQ